MEALGRAQAPRWSSQLDGWRGECRPKATWARESCRPSPAGGTPGGMCPPQAGAQLASQLCSLPRPPLTRWEGPSWLTQGAEFLQTAGRESSYWEWRSRGPPGGSTGLGNSMEIPEEEEAQEVSCSQVWLCD